MPKALPTQIKLCIWILNTLWMFGSACLFIIFFQILGSGVIFEPFAFIILGVLLSVCITYSFLAKKIKERGQGAFHFLITAGITNFFIVAAGLFVFAYFFTLGLTYSDEDLALYWVGIVVTGIVILMIALPMFAALLALSQRKFFVKKSRRFKSFFLVLLSVLLTMLNTLCVGVFSYLTALIFISRFFDIAS